jgi:glycosyltransferase involved in cell wall biosynthesis
MPFSLSPLVVYCDLDVRLYHHYRYHGLKKYYYRYKLVNLLIKRLRSEIREIMPDVIVCSRVEMLDYILKAKGNIPLIFESHSSYNAMEKKGFISFFKQRYYNRLVKKTQMVVALTEGDALEWRKVTNHVSVIPNVVHLNETGRYSDCRSKSVIFVGRYSYQKDIRTLLKIWEQVHQRHPDWSLHVFGGYGDEQETLPSLIQRMGMNIVMHEPTSTIFEEYLRSSMLLMTSRYEPFGLVLPEAMSCGLPVVSFDCPYGPADIITHEIDGFLVPGRDVNRYVEYVCQLIENPELRQTMGAAGIKASQRYQADRIMPQWQKLFVSLTSKEPSSKRIE